MKANVIVRRAGLMAGSSRGAVMAGRVGAASAFSLTVRQKRRQVSKYLPQEMGPKRFRRNDTREALAIREAADRALLEAEALANDDLMASIADAGVAADY